MTPDFVDDRLDKDMVDIRHIMKHTGTAPIFTVKFIRNSSNNIAMQITSENTTMPVTTTIVKTVEQIGQAFMEYIADTANWI